MAIAVDVIKPAINNTKQLLFPIKVNDWLKLGLVSLLNRRNVFNQTSIRGPFKLFEEPILSIAKAHIVAILSGMSIFFLFGVIYQWLSSVFSFVFIESIVTKKTKIKEYFNKHIEKGTSLFMWTFLMFLLLLILILTPAIPIILAVVKNFDNLSWGNLGISLAFLVMYIAYLSVVMLFYIIIDAVISNFTMMEMYVSNKRFWPSFRTSLNLAKKNISEVIIYFIMKLILSFATAFFAFIILIPLILIFLLTAAFFALILVLLVMISKVLLIPAVIVGVIIAIILIALLIYSIAVVMLPFSTFFVNYMYLFYTKMRK